MSGRRPCLVTTSWDDGHPCDLRVAELLARYGLPGTFYVPATGQRHCIAPPELRTLGQSFDIGAHTLRHVPLAGIPDSEARSEIRGSKDFIEQQLGKPCRVFAAPWGRFRRAHVQIAAEAGFRGFRTTELMSIDLPALREQLVVMPTTVQVFRHNWPAYWRNALRRGKPLNVALYLRHARGRDLLAAFDSLLEHAISRRSVLHLWGHGWEIDDYGEWPLLEQMLSRIAQRRKELCLASNSDLCEWVLRDGDSARAVPHSQLS